ncbi:deformed epidermal autoregulatory factor 1 homolog [Ciona intestinalis]
MSDESQSFPSSYEDQTDQCNNSAKPVQQSSHENAEAQQPQVPSSLRNNDDSVFITNPGLSNQTIATDGNAEQKKFGSSARSQTALEQQNTGAQPSGGQDNTNVQIDGAVHHIINNPGLTIQPSMKTLFVMSPNMIKGMNFQQLPVVSLPKSMTFGRSASSSAVLVSKPATKSPKDGKVVEVSYPHSPLSSPGYSGEVPINILSDIHHHGDKIPVTCRKNRAILDKRKLGSGQRGKCISFKDKWMTPGEFETECGLSMSKDWKRSIRYGGCTVQKLINEGHLHPHSAVCTCAVCSDDDSVTCPVRLFQPYKRRKRSAPTNPYSPVYSPVVKLMSYMDPNTPNPPLQSPGPPHSAPPDHPQQQKQPTTNHPLPQEIENILKSFPSEPDISEQRLWWQLDEISNQLLEQANRLKAAISEAKTYSMNRRIQSLHSIACKIEQWYNDHKQPEETNQSEVADQTELSTASCEIVTIGSIEGNPGDERVEDTQCFCTCGKPAISECTGCHRATYCSTACQEKDWLNGHSEACVAYRDNETVVSTSHEDVETYVVVTSATTSHNSSPLSV